ncbi:hypothetical protein JXA12_04345 [Candidatus Woesearchaeota archaeon]|nr:hypothetical protein [Candidatus Woesearchaeota archaeon]
MVAGKLFRFVLYAGSGLAVLWGLFASVLHSSLLLAASAAVIVASKEFS